MADIVDDFLTRLQALAPDTAAQLAPRLEAELRQHWGGTDRHYIRKGTQGHPRLSAAGAQQRAAAVATGLQQGLPLSSVFSQAGVSRSAGYRMLSRRNGAGR